MRKIRSHLLAPQSGAACWHYENLAHEDRAVAVDIEAQSIAMTGRKIG